MGISVIKKNRRRFQQILLAAVVFLILTAATAETVYGPEWTRTCTGNYCKVSVGEPNLLVGGKYLPFNQAVTIRWENREGLINGFVVYFPEGTITVEPSVTIDKTTVLMSDTAKTVGLTSIRATPTIKGTKAYEYALQIDDIPSEKSLDNVLFRLRLDGIKEEDLKLDETNSRLIILDKYALGFEDLKETGYTIRFLDKTTLEITGTADKRSLLLDPTVTLSSAKVLDDTQVYSDAPTTNYGTDTTMYVRETPSGVFWRSFIKFNLTGAVTYNATNTVNASDLNVYGTYANHEADDSCHGQYFNVYGVADETFDESTITWNLQPTLTSYLTHSLPSSCTYYSNSWMTFSGSALSSWIQTRIRNSTYENISFGLTADEAHWVIYDWYWFKIRTKEYGSGYEILNFEYYVGTTTTTSTTTTSSGATTTSTTTTTSTAATSSTTLLPIPMTNMTAGYTNTLFGVKKETFFIFVSWLAVSGSLMLFGAAMAGKGLLISAALSWYLWAIGWLNLGGSVLITPLFILLITIVAVVYNLKGDRRPL